MDRTRDRFDFQQTNSIRVEYYSTDHQLDYLIKKFIFLEKCYTLFPKLLMVTLFGNFGVGLIPTDSVIIKLTVQGSLLYCTYVHANTVFFLKSELNNVRLQLELIAFQNGDIIDRDGLSQLSDTDLIDYLNFVVD